ncbi:hypothetical protein JOB18_008739 [Solea senegalensis]|uniref:Uncharacterized protein n=1 Tax=Solea senegalensis TaxID=28829 RepID=A0AAV6Q546_SOLSE|nr:hypothetical protein JOB18_008739 [Solea senegalensis]
MNLYDPIKFKAATPHKVTPSLMRSLLSLVIFDVAHHYVKLLKKSVVLRPTVNSLRKGAHGSETNLNSTLTISFP